MGYQLQPNAPQITVAGRTLAMSAIMTPTVVGKEYRFGLFEFVNGEWTSSYDPDDYINSGECVAAVQKAGGIVPFIRSLVDRENTWLQQQSINTSFAVTIPALSEPTTDDQVLADLQSVIAAGAFFKQPLPAAFQAALDAYWSSYDQTPQEFNNGLQVARIGRNLCLLTEENGNVVACTPHSDMNIIARKCPSAAALWKAQYGFEPQ